MRAREGCGARQGGGGEAYVIDGLKQVEQGIVVGALGVRLADVLVVFDDVVDGVESRELELQLLRRLQGQAVRLVRAGGCGPGKVPLVRHAQVYLLQGRVQRLQPF
eukprot:3540461-Prymnesium_polylepis.1